MPNLQGYPVEIVHKPPPEQEEVFQVRVTKEICGSYNEYYELFSQYRKPQYTSANSAAEVTLEQAMHAERKKTPQIKTKLTAQQQQEVLQYCHFKFAGRFEQLVDSCKSITGVAKAQLKPFMKECLYREQNGPWMVKEDWLNQFNIDTTPPADLVWSEKEQKFKQKALGKPKFPVEDTEVGLFSQIPPIMKTVPEPSKQFVVQQVGDLLAIYNFVYVFSKPLQISPFTLDDFELSLVHDEMTPIVKELHVALLKQASKQASQRHSKLEKLSKQLPKHKIQSLLKKGQQRLLDGAAEAAEASLESLQAQDGEGTDIVDDEDVMVEGFKVEKMWWRMTVTHESWIEVLLTFLAHSATAMQVPLLASVLNKLSKNAIGIDLRTGRALVQDKLECTNEYVLTVEEKLQVLKFIIHESVIGSKLIHDYIDAVAAELPDLKRDKREVESEKKKILEDKKQFDKATDAAIKEASIALKEAEPVAAVPTEEDASQEDEEMDIEDQELYEDDREDEEMEYETEYDAEIVQLELKLKALDDEGRGNRAEKLKLQQQLREVEDARRQFILQIARAAAQQKNAENRAASEKRRQMDTTLSSLHKDDMALDREIRYRSAAVHLKPLGHDRYWNRYWWIDGFGSGMASVAEFGVSGRQNNHYATGRLLVEGVGMKESLGYVSGATAMMNRKRKPVEGAELEGWIVDPFVSRPAGQNGVKPGQHLGLNWLNENEWAYYDSMEKLDELLCYLNPKGVREAQLKVMLEKYYEHLCFNFQKRQDYLEAREQGVAARKESFLRYVNKT